MMGLLSKTPAKTVSNFVFTLGTAMPTPWLAVGPITGFSRQSNGRLDQSFLCGPNNRLGGGRPAETLHAPVWEDRCGLTRKREPSIAMRSQNFSGQHTSLALLSSDPSGLGGATSLLIASR